MYRFFARNGLPLSPVVRPPVHSLAEALAYLHALPNATRWPLYLKMCHLTAGSASSTRALPSREHVLERMGELEAHVRAKCTARHPNLCRVSGRTGCRRRRAPRPASSRALALTARAAHQPPCSQVGRGAGRHVAGVAAAAQPADVHDPQGALRAARGRRRAGRRRGRAVGDEGGRALRPRLLGQPGGRDGGHRHAASAHAPPPPHPTPPTPRPSPPRRALSPAAPA